MSIIYQAPKELTSRHGPALSRLPKYILTWLFALAISLVLVSAPVRADGAASADVSQFFSMINDLRGQNGLPPLELDDQLVQTSAVWNSVIVNNGELAHAPDLSDGMGIGWSKLGENVGVATAGETTELFDAFVASPTHLANLLDPDFGYVGISVIYDDTGRMWTTHRFMQMPEGVPANSLTQPGHISPDDPTQSGVSEVDSSYLFDLYSELEAAGI